MKDIFKIAVIVFVSLMSIEAQTSSADIVAGKIIIINSDALNEQRPVYIGLPTQYEQSNEKYPVLFVLDGEGNFAFSNGLNNFLGQTGRVPKMIVVGIPNRNRNRDFAPTVVPGQYGGGADRFVEFLKDELIPFLNKNYRTSSFRILFGHSLGGTFNFYTMGKYPDLFAAHIAASPYLEYDNRFVLNRLSEELNMLSDKKRMLYITLGNEPAYLESIDEALNILNDAPGQLKWKYEHLEEEDHNSVRLRALYRGLEFIFSDWQIEGELIAEGCAAIKGKYEKMKDNFGFDIYPDENTLNTIGYAYLNVGRINEAIQTFTWNVELYPESSNVYDSLGEAYEKNNEPASALENYKKAFEAGTKSNSPNLSLYENNIKRIEKFIMN